MNALEKSNEVKLGDVKSINSVNSAVVKQQKKNATQNNPCYFAKVVITGDLNVGKTSLVRTLLGPENVISLKGQKTGRVKTELKRTDSNIYMDIWDTAGQERYRSLTASYYRGAHGCLILFDITKHHTFDSVSSWLQDLKQYTIYPEKVSSIIVGTKCHATTKREVPKEKAEAFADHVGLPYMEVSSEEDINVREVFDLLADNIIEAFKRHPSMIELQPTTKLSDNNTKDKFSWCSC